MTAQCPCAVLILFTLAGFSLFVPSPAETAPPKSFELGQSAFRDGDSIRIESVQRTPEVLKVSGTYTLNSDVEAILSLFITATDTRYSSSPIAPEQQRTVERGSGTFELSHPNPYPGLPHVTFYTTDPFAKVKPLGSVYFGTAQEADASRSLKLNDDLTPTRPSSPPQADTGHEFVQKKLVSIVIPRIEFGGASIEEAVEFLRVKSFDLDEPKGGINMTLKLGDTPPVASIDLSLSNIPLGKALDYVTEIAGYAYKIEHGQIILFPAPETALPKTTPPSQGKAAERAKQIVFPQVQFAGAIIEEAAEFVRTKSRDVYEPIVDFPNVILMPGGKADLKFDLDLKDVSMWDALGHIARLTGYLVRSDDYTLILEPR